MTISRKPISIKDVAFRTSFGLGPEKTENQGPNRERKAGRWGESMVRRGALERCETGSNPLETRGKTKLVTPKNDPRETGLSFRNGGGGGNRTRVLKRIRQAFYRFIRPLVCRKRAGRNEGPLFSYSGKCPFSGPDPGVGKSWFLSGAPALRTACREPVAGLTPRPVGNLRYRQL